MPWREVAIALSLGRNRELRAQSPKPAKRRTFPPHAGWQFRCFPEPTCHDRFFSAGVNTGGRGQYRSKVGSVAQQAVVTSQTQLVEPSHATLGGLVGNKLIADLPLVSRDILTRMTVVPGVAPSLPNNYQSTFFTTTLRFSLNGDWNPLARFCSMACRLFPKAIYGRSALPTIDAVQGMRVQATTSPLLMEGAVAVWSQW